MSQNVRYSTFICVPVFLLFTLTRQNRVQTAIARASDAHTAAEHTGGPPRGPHASTPRPASFFFVERETDGDNDLSRAGMGHVRVPAASESDERSTLVVGSRPSTCALACAALGEPRQRLRWFAALFATEPLPDLEHLYPARFLLPRQVCVSAANTAQRRPRSSIWPTLASRCQGLPVHLTTTDP